MPRLGRPCLFFGVVVRKFEIERSGLNFRAFDAPVSRHCDKRGVAGAVYYAAREYFFSIDFPAISTSKPSEVSFADLGKL